MRTYKIRWQLVLYDLMVYAAAAFLLLYLYESGSPLTKVGLVSQVVLGVVCIFAVRLLGGIYRQIWRYGGIQCYIQLLVVDACGCLAYLAVEQLLPIQHIAFPRLLSVCAMNLLGSLAIRMIYRYAYKCGNSATGFGRFLNVLLRIFAGAGIANARREEKLKVKVAIIGAGRVGVSLAEELLANSTSAYSPQCFVDVDKRKADRHIHGLPVLLETEGVFEELREAEVQEVLFAVPDLGEEQKKQIYKRYLDAGYKLKVYDYSVMHVAAGKRTLREFDIEDLLFRQPVQMQDEKTADYYKDKVILITGGGGSIGSELCRQLAKMQPRQIIILDICENGAYDVQQEMRIIYGNRLDLKVEIASINNRRSMTRVFQTYHPQIVINAAAHKHVPLMENNCIEAVENNVFGTVVLVELCEQFQAERFMMVSTDKAVNPTNVMGATKRVCEMIVQCASTAGAVKYSCTRFGNVLGSAGSVIPLFKKQIASGGPLTITDKRIVRYFMTIPEASQLVLQSGAMAKNGELFVLDMGQPVKILDLAQSMIRLSGAQDIEIVETGLRPGEKLYEELLVKTEELDKTENSLIFIERDTPCTPAEMEGKVKLLRAACASENDETVRAALHQVVPTYKTPEEVNAVAEVSQEMQNSTTAQPV